jgi:hypothetical protein
VGPNGDGSECAYKADTKVIVTLSSSEQSRLVSYFCITGQRGSRRTMYKNSRTPRVQAPADFFNKAAARVLCGFTAIGRHSLEAASFWLRPWKHSLANPSGREQTIHTRGAFHGSQVR